jgi:Protein of unknown function (DUF3892)
MPQPQSVEIDCATKTARPLPHERIAFVGGRNPRGTRWKLSQDQAIDGIKSERWAFYLTIDGKPVAVTIARGPRGHEYLKTEADAVDPTSLLLLPDCP